MDEDLKNQVGASMDVSLMSAVALVVTMKQVGVIYDVFQSVLCTQRMLWFSPSLPRKERSIMVCPHQNVGFGPQCGRAERWCHF